MMNIPYDDSPHAGRITVLGKVGRGAGFHMKTMVVEGRSLFASSSSLDDLRAFSRRSRSLWRKPQLAAGVLDPLQATPAQMILGKPKRDHELWRRMVYLDAALKGQRVIELIARDSRRGGQPSDVELTAGEYFTVDASRLSCSAPSEQGHTRGGI